MSKEITITKEDVSIAPEKRSLRRRLFDIIEVSSASGVWSNLYDYIMIVVIVASLVPLAFKASPLIFTLIDRISVAIFIVDYLLRWITADFKYGKKSAVSFLRYPFSLYAIIDLVSILPSLTVINNGFKLLRLLRMLRAFRAFRVFKALRYSKSISIIASVLQKQKTPLMAVGTLAVGYILVSALVVFNVEPETFRSFFDAVYWATISLTTVGYGDIYPVTAVGRVVTMVSSIFGIAIVALPAGIITAGYMSVIGGENQGEEKT